MTQEDGISYIYELFDKYAHHDRKVDEPDVSVCSAIVVKIEMY